MVFFLVLVYSLFLSVHLGEFSETFFKVVKVGWEEEDLVVFAFHLQLVGTFLCISNSFE